MNLEIQQSVLNLYNHHEKKTNDSFNHLASGKRVNSAADDAAAMSMITSMTANMGGYERAVQNTSDGSSLLSTADGAASNMQDVLQRMRDLSVQADNGTLNASDKQSLQNEANQLGQELDHIANTTQFNGTNLLDGSKPSVSIHDGSGATDTTSINLINGTSSSLGVNAVDLVNNPQAAISSIDNALNTVSSFRSNIGATQNTFSTIQDNLQSQNTATAEARSRIQDADMASAVSDSTKNQILQQSSLAVMQQQNQNATSMLKFLM